MIWYIDDFNEHQIVITDTIREWTIPKFRIYMEVEEPILYLYWNDREQGDGGDERILEIDYRDVVDGYGGYVDNPVSATALMATIETMIVSGFSTGTGDLLTAKADLLSHDGVSDTILPAGTNEYILSRDNGEQTGLRWIPNGARTSSYIYAYTGLVNSTNTTSEELLWNMPITGGTITAGDVVQVFMLARKTSGTGLQTFKCYLNNVATIGGAGATSYTLIQGVSAQSYIYGPEILFTSTTAQVGTGNFGQYSTFGGLPGTGTLDVANTIWVQITSTKATGTDGFSLYGAVIKIHKYRP